MNYIVRPEKTSGAMRSAELPCWVGLTCESETVETASCETAETLSGRSNEQNSQSLQTNFLLGHTSGFSMENGVDLSMDLFSY